jgi:hypothetical protein
VAMSARWIAGHRRYSLHWLGRMRRILGPTLARFVEKRLITPWERLANWRQFPPGEFGQPSPPQVRIVHAPPANGRRAG